MKTKKQIVRDRVIEDLFAVIKDLADVGDLNKDEADEAMRRIRETEARMIEIENAGICILLSAK